MTNFEWIKGMSIDELAHFCGLMRYDENDEIPFCNFKECDAVIAEENAQIPIYMCENCFKKWLESEHSRLRRCGCSR